MNQQTGLQVPQRAGTIPAQPGPAALSVMPPQEVPDENGEEAPPPPPPSESMSLTDAMGEAQDWFKQLERSLAGYNHLQGSYETFIGQVRPGQRPKGLPIMAFKATANGRDAIECAIDLRNCAPEHVPHVLVPLLNAQAKAVNIALLEIQGRLDMLRKLMQPG